MAGVNPPILGGRTTAPGQFGSTNPNAGQTIQELVSAILGLHQYQRGFQNSFGQAAAASPAADLASLRSGVAPQAAVALGGQSLAAAAPPEIETTAGLLDTAAAHQVSQFQQQRLLEELMRIKAASDPNLFERFGPAALSLAGLLGGAGMFKPGEAGTGMDLLWGSGPSSAGNLFPQGA